MRKYGLLVSAAVRSELQYRANLWIMIAGGLAYQGVGIAFIWVILERFETIRGWSFADVAFLYGIRLTAHSLWVVPGSQLIEVDLVVREGEFDRFLVRPMSPLIQLLARRIRLTTLGDLLGGVVLLAVTSAATQIDWSPGSVLVLLFAVIGGALVEGSLQLAASALTFRIQSTFAIKTGIDSVFNEFGNYPLSIFGPTVRFALTFVFPLAFVAYFPSTVLLHRTGELAVPVWLAYVAPAIGGLLMFLAYRFWIAQSRHYSSSGH